MSLIPFTPPDPALAPFTHTRGADLGAQLSALSASLEVAQKGADEGTALKGEMDALRATLEEGKALQERLVSEGEGREGVLRGAFVCPFI